MHAAVEEKSWDEKSLDARADKANLKGVGVLDRVVQQ